ncbi:MAG: nucleoside kinase [Firmicutes bacterium]|nr:nucleoside kinase [Bacillota bacterium]
MKIKLIKELRAEPIEIDVEDGTIIEDLVKEYQKDLEYRVIAAKRNNTLVDLSEEIIEPCIISFLDMRTQAANLIYEKSLSLIYLKAVEDVLGRVPVEIQNVINKGLYTEVKAPEPVTKEQIQAIENRMHEIVNADLPFEKYICGPEEAMKIMEEDGYKFKQRLFSSMKVKRVRFYTLDGYRNFFYGLMTPSSGYIEYFELMKYRNGVLIRFPHPSNPKVIPEYVDQKLMYATFGEATRWQKLLGINYVDDLNEKVRNGEYKEIIQLSEALHEKRIAEIADMIKEQKKRIILIAGPSSSGKTTFARRLCVQLRVCGLKPLYMGTDDYFVEREQTPLDEFGERDFECLEAVDVELFNKQMNALLAGEQVDLPTFDFMTGHKEYGKRLTSITSNQPIVIEGIHALNDAMTPHIPAEQKFKIYISPLTQLNIDEHNRISTTDSRMLRRMVRDFKYRGHDAQETIRTWPKVRHGEDKYIFPYNGEADVFFNSVHIYEFSVLKKYAEPLLEAIFPDEPEYMDAARMLKFLKYFEVLEDNSIIVNNSIIREFIGGSIFVD